MNSSTRQHLLRQADMVYSEYDDGSDSAEDRRTRHVRINERAETIVPTDGFTDLNNPSGGSRPSRPNLNVPLGNRTVQYTQHSNFEAQASQHRAPGRSTIRPHQDEEIDLNFSLDLNNPSVPTRRTRRVQRRDARNNQEHYEVPGSQRRVMIPEAYLHALLEQIAVRAEALSPGQTEQSESYRGPL